MKKLAALILLSCAGCVTYTDPGYHDWDGVAKWNSADYNQSWWCTWQSEPGTPIRRERSK